MAQHEVVWSRSKEMREIEQNPDSEESQKRIAEVFERND